MGDLARVVPKSLLPWGDAPIVDAILTELAEAGCEHVVVLTGTAQSRLVGDHLEAANKTWGITVSLHDSGLSDLSASLKDLPWGYAAESVVIAHCDELIDPALTRTIAETSRGRACPVIAAYDGCLRSKRIVELSEINPVGPADGVLPTHRFVGRYAIPARVLEDAFEANVKFENILEILEAYRARGRTVLEVSSGSRYWDLGTLGRYTHAWRERLKLLEESNLS